MSKNKFNALISGEPLPDPATMNVESVVDELWREYADSTNSFLSELEQAAMALESGANVEESSAEIRRILHSIKGESGIIGVNDVYELCHIAESAFEGLDSSQAADIVLKVKDWISAGLSYALNPDDAGSCEEYPEHFRCGSKLKALVIDDAPICRKRLKMLLEGHFDCEYALNGREGVTLYQDALENGDPYNLVTLDINMPELNGHETLKEIRRLEEEHGLYGLDGVKIVMTTSESSSKHVFSAFREGCEAYVVKLKLGEKLLDEIAKLGLLREHVHKSYTVG
jgi:two-component system chemotaxis response regulator CheY